MNNKNFSSLSEKQKRNKLKFILKEKTQGCLTESELTGIIDGVKLNRQYIIQLHFTAKSFEEALVKPKMGDGKVILGSAVFADENGPGCLNDKTKVTAVIVRKPYVDTENTIHIYIPPRRKSKAKKHKSKSMILCDRKCVDEKFICHHIEYNKNSIFCAFDPPKGVNKRA